MAESLDGKHILVGEAKWSGKTGGVKRLAADLRARAAALPIIQGKSVVLALWLRGSPSESADPPVVLPDQVLYALRR